MFFDDLTYYGMFLKSITDISLKYTKCIYKYHTKIYTENLINTLSTRFVIEINENWIHSDLILKKNE